PVTNTKPKPEPAPVVEAEAKPEPKPEAKPAPKAESGVPDGPRARSVSGEIRVPVRRAPSIKPPMPEPLEEDDDSPVIEIEADAADEDPTGPRKVAPARRRQQKSNPPELAARAGEVEMRTGPVKSVTHD